MSIANQNGWSVAHRLAVINGAALGKILAGEGDGFVRGILSITDQNGNSVAHRLAVINGAALGEILAEKDPGFVRDILSIADHKGVSVAQGLAGDRPVVSDPVVNMVTMITPDQLIPLHEPLGERPSDQGGNAMPDTIHPVTPSGGYCVIS